MSNQYKLFWLGWTLAVVGGAFGILLAVLGKLDKLISVLGGK